MEHLYFLSYLALATLVVFALLAGCVALLVQWLRELRPWRSLPQLHRWRPTGERHDPAGPPHEPIARFPSRP